MSDSTRPRLPALSALRAFEAAARHGSFRKAAEELGVTPSAVSHQIAQLEEDLAVALFHRRARGTDLSEAGRLYQSYVQDGFARLAAGTEAVRRRFGRRELVVQVYVSMAVRWLIPRLSRLDAAGLDLTVRINANRSEWAFDAEASDVGLVSLATPRAPGIRFRPLFDADLAVLARPDVAAGLGDPAGADLGRLRLLTVFSAPDDWAGWLVRQGLPPPARAGTLQLDSYLLALEAAADGQGLALAPRFLAADDIRRGRLAVCFSDRPRLAGRWYLACRQERAAEPAIAAFRAWVLAEVAADPDLAPLQES